jgi:hypothetical protein
MPCAMVQRRLLRRSATSSTSPRPSFISAPLSHHRMKRPTELRTRVLAIKHSFHFFSLFHSPARPSLSTCDVSHAPCRPALAQPWSSLGVQTHAQQHESAPYISNRICFSPRSDYVVQVPLLLTPRSAFHQWRVCPLAWSELKRAPPVLTSVTGARSLPQVRRRRW